MFGSGLPLRQELDADHLLAVAPPVPHCEMVWDIRCLLTTDCEGRRTRRHQLSGYQTLSEVKMNTLWKYKLWIGGAIGLIALGLIIGAVRPRPVSGAKPGVLPDVEVVQVERRMLRFSVNGSAHSTGSKCGCRAQVAGYLLRQAIWKARSSKGPAALRDRPTALSGGSRPSPGTVGPGDGPARQRRGSATQDRT
jgi:hypothetical protein